MNELNDFLSKINNQKILRTNYENKSVVIIGEIDKKKVIIEHKPKLNTNINLSEDIIETKKIVDNNRFKKYECLCDKTWFDISTIFPALSEDLKKFSPLKKFRSTETYEFYIKNIYPKILKQDLTWIYNILDGKSEQGDIIYEDKDFVLLPDIKWDRKDMNGVYCLAIVKNRNLRSIRDLNSLHLNLLKNIYIKTTKTIKNLYKINTNKLRAYLHYHPSFWHLHIHFNLIDNNSESAISDISHPLMNVIRNIELMDDYYQKIDIDIVQLN